MQQQDKEKKIASPVSITFYLNTRIPIAYIENSYQKYVEEYLAKHALGKTTGNGQSISKDKTEAFEADFTVELAKRDEAVIAKTINILEEAGAPVGSYWKFDAVDERTDFGTLDALIIRFTNIPSNGHEDFETFLSNLIEAFHKDHSDTAGFQGVSFAPEKCVVAFHGFENSDMEKWLTELINEQDIPYLWSIEQTANHD